MTARLRRWRLPHVARFRAQGRTRPVAARSRTFAAAIARRWRGRRPLATDGVMTDLRRAGRHADRGRGFSFTLALQVAGIHWRERQARREPVAALLRFLRQEVVERIHRAATLTSITQAIAARRSARPEAGLSPAVDRPGHLPPEPSSSLLRVAVDRLVGVASQRALPPGRNARIDSHARTPHRNVPERVDTAPRYRRVDPAAAQPQLASHARRVGHRPMDLVRIVALRADGLGPQAERGGMASAAVGRFRRSTVAALVADPHTPLSRRTLRVERLPVAQISMAGRPASDLAAVTAAADLVRPSRPASRPASPAGSAPPDRRELERAIAAGIEQQLDRKVGAAVRTTLARDPEVSRVVTERVYGDIYDRMVLERERLR